MKLPLSQRKAVIDVGTNSVKLLIADVDGPRITPVSEESNQTRLGVGFYDTHQFQPSAIARTAEAVANYSSRAAKLGAGSVRVVATSAARDALNAVELVIAIRKGSGLEMEILSGRQEADAVFRGVTSNPALAQIPVLILDIGGGSAEFIVGENSVPWFSNSYELGTVRLLEQLKPADPPGAEALAHCRKLLRDFLNSRVAPTLEPALGRCTSRARLVGTGGTPAILARMETSSGDFNRELIESTPLSLQRIRSWLENQWQMTLASRRKIPGLPPDRADVILTGMAIYEAIMERFGFDLMQVSTRGLRYWALVQ